jgi:hypothetical protein
MSTNSKELSAPGGLFAMDRQNREGGENPPQSRYCNW